MEKKKLPRTFKELDAAMQKVQESAYQKGREDEIARPQRNSSALTPSRPTSAVEQLAESLARKQEARTLLTSRQAQLVSELTEVNTNLAQNNLDRLQLLRDFDRFSQ